MTRKQIFQILEIIIIFVGLPLLYKYDLIPFHKSIPLLTVFAIYLVVLLRSKSFDRKMFGSNKYNRWLEILFRVAGFFGFALLIVYLFFPENIFFIPKTMPMLWLMILIFYPLWSAYPQELIYRAYFFHRFKDLVKDERWLIIINAGLFAFSHIIFRNWIAIALTFIGSFVFFYTYRKSRSLLVVFIEHALYGNIIFTVGLGEFFYLPFEGN